MKPLHFASILALAAATTFACNDDEDRVELRSAAGTSSEAGAAGRDDGAHEGGAAGLTGNTSGGAGEPNVVNGGAAGEGGNAVGGAAAGDAGLAGEAGAGGAPFVEPLELIGAYNDNFGGSFVISADAWASSAIVAYDNALNAVYTQFPADDGFNPNKFAKTVYTEPANDESFYFCMVSYSAATLAEAQASSATADDSDPENGGCGGQYPWTKATRR